MDVIDKILRIISYKVSQCDFILNTKEIQQVNIYVQITAQSDKLTGYDLHKISCMFNTAIVIKLNYDLTQNYLC